MAKQVSNIFINLGIKNAEGLDKLKSAFRELDKAVGPTSKSIDSAIAAVKRFSDSNERSEQLIRGQIEAFKGLRSQVDVGGNRYAALTNEIGKLQAELRGSTDALERQREKLLRTASAGSQNAKSLQTQITALERLKQQTRPGSSAFDQLTKDIDKARIALGRFKTEASQAASTVTAMPGSTFQKVADQVAILQRRMQTLNFSSAEFLKYQQRINLVNLVQSTTVGRQQVRANAELYASPQYGGFVRSRAEALSLPATPAGYQQRIGEINAELQNVSNLERRRELTLELDRLNRQLKGTIIDATSAEQRAVDVVRARVNAQREALSQSGFGTFSAGITGRSFKAEQQQQNVADVKTAFASIEQARDTMDASVRAATQRTVQLELDAAQLVEERKQKAHDAYMKRDNQEYEAALKKFNLALQNRDIQETIEKRKRILQGEIGIPTTTDLSPFYESVVGLGTALPRRSQQFMGRAPQQVLGDIMYQASAGKILDPVNQDLKTFNTLSDLSTSSIGELSSALGKLKTELRPIDAGYKQLNTSIERNEKIIEDTLRKRGNAQRQRLGGQQLAQIAGASISGGIFGGPEGLVGGVAGGIVGGVGGSFAGAAIGAQAGMLRQQLGGTADYAAQIGKLQIALRGVAGTQSNYNQALNAAAAATRDLNVPQMEAIQGITRLSAAVLGAGGTIGDANFAFRAISESIKATGGNAEQVDGAMLALTQVFSKGKVSAEELNQIAERLPGTFTLFAQATGKTGPELQKALQQGQVGLNDLMKFLELASSKYGQTALKIAASSEEAGARTKIAFDQMRLEVGKALQPLGAKFQAAFESFIKDIGPAVLAVTKGVSAALQFFFDNRAAASAAEFSLKVGLVASAFAALRAAMSAAVSLNIASWFSTTAASAKITGDVLTSTGAQVTGFKATLMGLQGVLSRLAAIGIITVTVDVLVQGYARLKAMEEELEKLRAERTSEGPTGPQLVMTAQRRYTGASRETVAADIEKQRNLLAALKKQYAEATGYRFELNIPGDVFSTQRRLAESELLRARIKKAEEVINLDLSQFKTRSEIEAERRADIDRRFGNLTPTDDTTTTRTRAAAREAAQDLKERQRLERELASLSDAAQRPIILSKQKILAFDLQIQRANADSMALEVGRLEIGKNKYELDLAKEKLLIDEREALQASADNEDQTNRLLRDRITQQKTVVALRELELNFAKDTALREAQLATTMEKQRESLASAFTDRRRELGLISRSEYTAALLERERRRLTSEAEGATPEQRAQALDLYRQQIDPTPFESITQQVGRLRDELEELSNSANIVKGAAQSIGESFSTSFTSLINGTATAQQALSGFFQSIANYFLDMAGKIIAKWIEMAILNTVLNLFPTGNLFGSSAGGGSFAGAWGGTAGQGAMRYLNTGPSLFAQGGVFGANKIVPYAKGGVVTRPMLFPFANGGAIGTGLMGEADPEAIMPLQRGPNGKLGVMAAGGGTTNVVVNVDATGGSSVQGDDDRANQLGKVISAAVQSELVKQKRPGGLLA